MATIRTTDTVVRNPETLSADVGDEAVALDIARGACFGLDSVAARVWSLIVEPITVEALCATLMDLYAVDVDTCRRDITDLLGELRAEGLIEVRPATSPRPS